MLADGSGGLQLKTSTSEAAKFVEVMQLNAAAGPCIDCFTNGIAVSVADIGDEDTRWPAFRTAALPQEFRSALATPMRLRGRIIGTMNVFGASTGGVGPRDAAIGQVLADVATIAILQERVVRESHLIEEQLHRALHSCIMIEQAKGVIASSLNMTMDEAFSLLRAYALGENLTIRFVAEWVSERALAVDDIATASHRTGTN